MAVRKKAATKKDHKEVAAMVTQVVEVVDEDTVSREEVKDIARDLKDEVADVEEKVEELEEKVEVVPKESQSQPIEASKEKDKEVLGDIFGGQDHGITPEISGSSSGSGRSLFVWALVVICVALLTGLGLLVAVRGPESVTSMFTSPAPSPTSTPILTPTPVAPNRAEITIEVLNGSGVAGAAAKMQEFLKGKGYEVGRAGNADNSDYEQTEIHVKSGKEQYLSLLETDSGEGYTVGTAAADLADSSDYDAQVIVGKE